MRDDQPRLAWRCHSAHMLPRRPPILLARQVRAPRLHQQARADIRLVPAGPRRLPCSRRPVRASVCSQGCAWRLPGRRPWPERQAVGYCTRLCAAEGRLASPPPAPPTSPPLELGSDLQLAHGRALQPAAGESGGNMQHRLYRSSRRLQQHPTPQPHPLRRLKVRRVSTQTLTCARRSSLQAGQLLARTHALSYKQRACA